MARIVVSEFVSLDGVMEAPGWAHSFRHAGWTMKFPDPDQFKYKFDEVLAHEALLVGRKTYEGFAAAWPSMTGAFADQMNNMPKYVASTTLENPGWTNTSVLKGDIAESVSKLKHGLHGDILVAGSRTLVNTLKQHDLIDEYRLMVFPIVLGGGMRLFDDTADTRTLKLVDTRTFASGTIVLTYHPSRTSPEVTA